MWQFNFLLRKTQWLGLNKARESIKELKSFQSVFPFVYLKDGKMWLKLNLTQLDFPRIERLVNTTGDSDTDQRVFNKLKKKNVNKL